MADERAEPTNGKQELFTWMARIVAVGGAIAISMLPPTSGLTVEAQKLAAVTFLMAVLWMTEAAPVILTSLLPLLLFPFFEISEFRTVLPVYVKDLIWLFFGGFQLAFAVEKCGLHRRMAMAVRLSVLSLIELCSVYARQRSPLDVATIHPRLSCYYR